jgi:hypothetical protein
VAARTATIPRTGKSGSRSSDADKDYVVHTLHDSCDEASLLCAEGEDAAISGVSHRHYRSILPATIERYTCPSRYTLGEVGICFHS